MIWIDFGIICIGQEHLSVPSGRTDIVIEGCQRNANSKPFYNDSYHFYTANTLPGCWYTIELPIPLCYEESFFDISDRGVTCVEVVPKWADFVGNILAFYIKESPVHRVAVLLRMQDSSSDVVHPDCKLDEFMQRLTDGSIKWNELYYVYS